MSQENLSKTEHTQQQKQMEKEPKPQRTVDQPSSLVVKARAYCPKCKTVWHGDITGAEEKEGHGVRFEKECASCASGKE